MGVNRCIPPWVVVLVLVFTGLGALSSRASAHATPHVLDIVFREDGGYVLLTNRGLIFGDKARKSWRLLCAEALRINTTEVPSLVATPDGRLLVATSVGLSATDDDGCTWKPVEPFGEISTPALAQDPSDPKRLYLAVYSPDASMTIGGLYRSEDGGMNWKQLFASNDRDYVRSIRVAPSDPKRIYATGQSWGEMGGKYMYYVAQSRDGGETWERKVAELGEREREIRLFEVSPKDPDLVTFRAASSDPMTIAERLLVSRDGGQNFENPISMFLLSQVAFSADGTKAWVVGLDGFFESTDSLKTFERVGPAASMSYVVEHEKQVLACGYYKGLESLENGIGAAASTSAADGFNAFMQLSEVTNPVACDAASKTGMVCAPWWLDWERELTSGQFAADGGVAGNAASGTGGAAGAANAGKGGASGASPSESGSGGASSSMSDAGVEPRRKSRSSGCAVAQPRDSTNLTFGFGTALVVLALLARRRRAR